MCVHWVKLKVNHHKTCRLWLRLVVSCQPHLNLSVAYVTAPDVTLNLWCGDIFSSAWMLTLKTGPMFWQGPHHVAVKSTTTNLSPAFFRALSKAGCRERKSWFSFQTDTFLPTEVHWNGRWWVIMLWFNQSGKDFQMFKKRAIWPMTRKGWHFPFEILKYSSYPF